MHTLYTLYTPCRRRQTRCGWRRGWSAPPWSTSAGPNTHTAAAARLSPRAPRPPSPTTWMWLCAPPPPPPNPPPTLFKTLRFCMPRAGVHGPPKPGIKSPRLPCCTSRRPTISGAPATHLFQRAGNGVLVRMPSCMRALRLFQLACSCRHPSSTAATAAGEQPGVHNLTALGGAPHGGKGGTRKLT